MIASDRIPQVIAAEVARGERLARWTLFWISGIALLMYLAMGSSQAMKTAMLEDVLSLVPSIAFLVATHFERRGRSDRFRYGFKRVNSLAFLIAAVALLSIGGFLAFEAVATLVKAEHPTVGTVPLFGQTIWLGWLMLATLAYSAIAPMILGRKKLPVARRINDKVLHTDALTQKADWQTAFAGILGVAGIGMGWWWADAGAALFISLSIIRDGTEALAKAATELLDGMPRSLDREGVDPDAAFLEAALARHYPGAEIRIRESGRYLLAQLVAEPIGPLPPSSELMPVGRDWRLSQVSFARTLASA